MTRHELKEQLQHDQFTDTVSNVLTYASSHRKTLVQWGVAAGIVLVVAGGILWYNSYRKSVRHQDLQAAFAVLEAPIGPHNDYQKTFATADEKKQASLKALSQVIGKDGGTAEGYLAQYYRGTLKAQANDIAGAEADLRAVVNSGADSAALAKIALANLYIGMKKTTEAQDLLKSIVNKPTDLVSKGQAQILLAQLDETANPQQAKQILKGLKGPGESPAIGRAADQISAQLAK